MSTALRQWRSQPDNLVMYSIFKSPLFISFESVFTVCIHGINIARHDVYALSLVSVLIEIVVVQHFRLFNESYGLKISWLMILILLQRIRKCLMLTF